MSMSRSGRHSSKCSAPWRRVCRKRRSDHQTPLSGMKKPRVMRGFSLVNYLARPEPGPVGVNVDPLGDALGASVLPEGFMELGAALGLVGALPVVVPLVGEVLVVPLMAGLPAPPAAG